MIFKTERDGQRWTHLFFQQDAKPDAVLEAVEALFAEIESLPPGEFFVRVKPSIERGRNFITNEDWAYVRCRMSVRECEVLLNDKALLGFAMSEGLLP